MGLETAAGPGRKYRLIATEESFSIPEQADEFRRIAKIAYSNPDLDMWRSFFDPVPNAPPLFIAAAGSGQRKNRAWDNGEAVSYFRS